MVLDDACQAGANVSDLNGFREGARTRAHGLIVILRSHDWRAEVSAPETRQCRAASIDLGKKSDALGYRSAGRRRHSAPLDSSGTVILMRVWFITGANRGFGLEIVRSALQAGDRVVATARRPETLQHLAGNADSRLAVVPLDVTDGAAIAAAVRAALERFGRIDVLVNNAGYGQLGPFESITPEAIEKQFATNLFGVFTLTRAVLPILRAQRAGHIINISSIAGLTGIPGASIYCSSKFALEGWSEALGSEVSAFGIKVTAIEPGRFRTDFLDPTSVRFGDVRIADYEQSAAEHRAALEAANHQQAGGPVKLANAIVTLVRAAEPPVHFPAGSEAIRVMLDRAHQLHVEAEAWRALSLGTDF